MTDSMALQHFSDVKNLSEHVEDQDSAKPGATGMPPSKAIQDEIDAGIIVAASVERSQYADLTPWETIKLFRHQFLTGVSVGLGAA